MEEKTLEEMLRDAASSAESSGEAAKSAVEADAAQRKEEEKTEQETGGDACPQGTGSRDGQAGQGQGDPGDDAGPDDVSEDAEEEAAPCGPTDDAGGEGGAEGPDGGSGQGFFSKLKKGDREKAALKDKVEALEDRVRRQMAEFDNFRKRTDREKQQMFSMGERNVIEKMLPIVDNFERGLAAVPEAEKEGPVASGMEMVYRQLMKQLEDLGVTPIEAVGREFDPDFHNAVMQVESQEYASGIVAQEFQKGYKYHDAVVRHSMVGVAQ